MCAFYFFITSLEQKASNSSVKSMNDIESCNLFLLNEGESSSAVLTHYFLLPFQNTLMETGVVTFAL